MKTTFKVERIRNGFVITNQDGEKWFAKESADIFATLIEGFKGDLRRASESEWDGHFEMTFSSTFSNLKGGANNEPDR